MIDEFIPIFDEKHQPKTKKDFSNKHGCLSKITRFFENIFEWSKRTIQDLVSALQSRTLLNSYFSSNAIDRRKKNDDDSSSFLIINEESFK